METRSLGPSGLQVSLIGLGCNNFGGRIDLAATRRVIDKAIELGITHFDTADVYGGGGKSEEFIGEILGDRRKGVVLATKFGKLPEAKAGTRGTAAYIGKAVEASLTRLRTDWIDLYYMHEPDLETANDETLTALDRLQKDGKIRAAAASNFTAGQVSDAVSTAKRLGVPGFTATQDEYSLLSRGIEDVLLPLLQTHRLALVPYFPLAGGALSGKYRKDAALPEGTRHAKGSDRFLTPHWETIEKLNAFATDRGHTLLELAFSWLAGRPQVASIIAGATRPEQLEANARAVAWKLSASELAEIDKITGR